MKQIWSQPPPWRKGSIDSEAKALKFAFDEKEINTPFLVRSLGFSLSPDQVLQFESNLSDGHKIMWILLLLALPVLASYCGFSEP